MRLSSIIEAERPEVAIAQINHGRTARDEIHPDITEHLDRHGRHYKYSCPIDSNYLHPRPVHGRHHHMKRKLNYRLNGRGILLEDLASEETLTNWLRPRVYSHETHLLSDSGHSKIYVSGVRLPLDKTIYADNYYGDHWSMIVGKFYITSADLSYIGDFNRPRGKPEDFLKEWAAVVASNLLGREKTAQAQVAVARQALLQAQRDYGQVAMLAKLAKGSMENFLTTMLDEMRQIPGIIKLEFNSDRVEITTEPFTVEAKGESWFLGGYNIRMNMFGSLEWRPLHQASSVGYYHPHGGITPCLGGYNELLGSAFMLFDYATVARVAVEFCRSFDENDSISMGKLTRGFGHEPMPLHETLPEYIDFFKVAGGLEAVDGDEGEE